MEQQSSTPLCQVRSAGRPRWRRDTVCSSGSSSEERITVDVEQPSFLFTTRATERIDWRTDPNVDKSDLFQHFLPGCARQTTGNSGCPKIDVSDRCFRHRLSIRNVCELQPPAWAQDAINLRKDRPLVSAKVYHTVADDCVRPSVFDGQILREAVPERHVSQTRLAVVSRDFASISSVMSTPITLPVGPT